MPREAIDLSLNEQTFIRQALREGERLDGRKFDVYRPLELKFGDAHGLADVSLGRTRIAARISSKVTGPLPERPFEGIFQVNTELSPMASPMFEAGRPTLNESLISRILEKTVRRSSAVDTESLCLVAGSKCFSVRADLHVLAFDGNLLDAACVALVAALQHFRRPDVTVEGGDVKIWNIKEKEPVKLSLFHHPLCVSFSYYDGGDILLLDATAAEENVREGEVSISMNKYGEICQVAKYGGVSVNAVTLLGCTRTAHEKVKSMDAFIRDKLAEDEQKRSVGDLIAELSAVNDR